MSKRRKQCWQSMKKIVTFAIHFIVVMLLLCCAAYVLAKLEDSEIMNNNSDTNLGKDIDNSTVGLTTTITSTITNNNNDDSANLSTHEAIKSSQRNNSAFLTHIRTKYNFSIHDRLHEEFFIELEGYIENFSCKHEDDDWHDEDHVDEDEIGGHHEHESHLVVRDKKFIFMKWFYFVIVATTTIGYGHVYPKTDEGKLFYITFSVIGIVLTMTLLRSCGKIIMAINKRFYMLIRRRICGGRGYISDQLTSVISMCFIFLFFMVLVVVHDKNINELANWSWVDTFYFWLVTFTTVGFGDVHFPLEVEIDHFYELVLYRVFGLSFLAGIIESIHEYIKYRKGILIMQHNQSRIMRKIGQRLSGHDELVKLS